MTIPDTAIESIVTQVETMHGILAYNGSQVVCACDRTWKPAEEYAAHITRAALTAAYPLIAVQAKAEVLAPILALHQPEKRWTTPDYTGSFDTREEAAELDESDDGPNVDYFEICAHCGSIERDWAEDHAEEWNYKLAMWPCKTIAKVTP